MSWLDRKIVNKNSSVIIPSVSEEEKQFREIKEDTTTLEDVRRKGTSNIVPLNTDRFMCGVCNHGWTFSRMKTIECCGITYVRN